MKRYLIWRKTFRQYAEEVGVPMGVVIRRWRNGTLPKDVGRVEAGLVSARQWMLKQGISYRILKSFRRDNLLPIEVVWCGKGNRTPSWEERTWPHKMLDFYRYDLKALRHRYQVLQNDVTRRIAQIRTAIGREESRIDDAAKELNKLDSEVRRNVQMMRAKDGEELVERLYGKWAVEMLRNGPAHPILPRKKKKGQIRYEQIMAKKSGPNATLHGAILRALKGE